MNLDAAMQLIALSAIPLIFAITLHEAAHGWIASKLGDTTALMLGRVTLNPAKHIDPIGTVILPIMSLILSGFMFGWAKPVPINYHQLNHPRRDMLLVALAGPAANLFMALLWGAIAKLSLFISVGDTHSTLKVAATFLHLSSRYGIFINCIFMMLNMLPLPPLDGSRIVSAILPPDMARSYEKIEPYGIWILLGLLMFGVLGIILWPSVQWFVAMISQLYGITPIY
jgi:Zn-dependent protease